MLDIEYRVEIYISKAYFRRDLVCAVVQKPPNLINKQL